MTQDLTDKVEEAIRAWFEDAVKSPHHRAGKGDVIIDWVVGFTVSNLVDKDDDEDIEEPVVGYANWLITPLGNPNAHVGLAQWVMDEIGTVLPH